MYVLNVCLSAGTTRLGYGIRKVRQITVSVAESNNNTNQQTFANISTYICIYVCIYRHIYKSVLKPVLHIRRGHKLKKLEKLKKSCSTQIAQV